MKDINQMSRKEFEKLPHRKWNEIIICDSIIVLSTRRIHESNYRCMDFVAVKDNKPVCLLSGCSDVIHVDGIGGYGDNWREKYKTIPRFIPPSGWSIDCLKKSGLFRMWPSSNKIKCGYALSSFEIFAEHEDAKKRPIP